MKEPKCLSNFAWLPHLAPEFCVNGNHIEILDTPESFHTRLKTEAKKASKRIVLAALYLGTGNLEQDLIDAVSESASESNNEVKIQILLDYVRGSRGKKNSITMLQPLMQQCSKSKNLQVALYHTPKLQGLVKTILPERWNEIVGVAHLKVFIFDDTFIISGANLSNDYFVNRQDRYMVFRDCPQLADYFHEVVNAVSRFSFQLDIDGGVQLDSGWDVHPYDDDLRPFLTGAQESVRSVISSHLSKDAKEHVGMWCQKPTLNSPISFARNILSYFLLLVKYMSSALFGVGSFFKNSKHYSDKSVLSSFSNLTDGHNFYQNSSCSDDNDTKIYPTIQMGLFGIRQDEIITELMMKSFPEQSTVNFTTGYFNVTDKYCNVMVENNAKYKILLASPEANGFLGSKGFSGYIPAVYVHLCKKFYEKVKAYKREHDFSLWEYIRKDWTFHGKGMWGYLPGEKLPSISLIGSPNFGMRSVNRDLEAQVVLVTKNKSLREKLHAEQNNLMRHTRKINADTFQQQRYKVPRWVAVVTFFIKRYF